MTFLMNVLPFTINMALGPVIRDEQKPGAGGSLSIVMDLDPLQGAVNGVGREESACPSHRTTTCSVIDGRLANGPEGRICRRTSR